MDFSDLQILGARDGTETETREHVMSIVRNYTRAFFDKYLKGTNTPVLDGNATDPLVERVEFFKPTQRPN